MHNPIRIGIVAGEVSGDQLGSNLIKAIKQHLPDAEFVGIAGPGMIAQGCRSLFSIDSLSVMGFIDVLAKLRHILQIRKQLVDYFIANPPDIFIGVDAPDFNLGVEQRLKQVGIPTVHYVSPTVWAWRGYRIKKIHKSVDHMLTLFPFEASYYHDHNIPVTFVGHPLAELIEEHPDKRAYRERLGLPQDRTLVALLPGSRRSELQRHADVFVQTIQWLHRRHPDYYYVIPFVNAALRSIFHQAIERHGASDVPLTELEGHSRDAMAAADIVLLASGTATMEAALLRRPMVVTYKVSWPNFLLIKFFSHVDLYAMPNNLAGRELVPEYVQSDAVPEKMGAEIVSLLEDESRKKDIVTELGKMYHELKRNASANAATAVLEVLRQRLPQERALALGQGV